MKPSHCPVCRKGAVVRKPFRFPEARLWQCQSCGLRFLSPQPRIAEQDLYDDEYLAYYGADKQGERSLFRMKDQTYRLHLASMRQWVKPGRVLDVGCASGHFLQSAERLGWTGYGLEIGTYGQEAQARFGAHRVKLTTLSRGVFPGNTFDAVTFWDVLEHMPDPREVVTIVRFLLRRGGVIALTTPDGESLSSRLLGRYWNHYHLDHLTYFTRKSLSTLMDRCAVTVRSIRPTKKRFNLAYIAGYFRAYPTPGLSQLASLLYAIAPKTLRERPVTMSSGSLFFIGQKM